MIRLGVGLVGFGRLAERYYTPALRRSQALEVAAIYDPRSDRRRRAGSAWPTARLATALDELLAADGVEAVLVASPPSTHLDAWRAAAAAGRPAFVEKPLLLTRQLGEARGRELAAPVMVDFNRRFWPGYREVRRRVLDGALGGGLELELRLHLDAGRWSTITAHRSDPGEGGLLHDLGSHALDLACWILGGEPVEIAARRHADSARRERWRIAVALADGSRAGLDLAYGGATRERLRIRGGNGRLDLLEPNLSPRISTAAERPRPHATVADAARLVYRFVRRSRSFGRASIAAALEAFATAVAAGGGFAPGIDDGLRNARWLATAERSAAAGGRPLPVEAGERGVSAERKKELVELIGIEPTTS